ncbi:peptidoglycan/LPS O-acetylase OafA/YrhL [Kribbella voronezhensis]|uniref:Peptidoglycan/LPS O-acetylase OafA/YrhL n=1 Tax=Kribbella voronezhensis TaxID=2512212 RepID=A0A4R7THA0_9ACTN|nr:acyltransferase [Kribbella voronezhensis]TDU90857.1 peptidoglycan/LPS O-acetylase OafA/YrhL [Kribbella voronezhensis]
MTGLTSVEQGAVLRHPRPEILALTGLRGLAALGVVASQVGVWRTAPPWLHHLVAAGSLGVPFFFLLSGFVLFYNYPTLSPGRSLSRYAVARIARLGPLFVVIGAGVLVLSRLNGGEWARSVLGPQTWYLGTALVLYAVYPALTRVVAADPARAAVCALAVQLVVLALRLGTGSDDWLYRNPLVWIPDLVLGMVLAGLAVNGFRLSRRTAYFVQGAVVVYAVAVVLAFGSSSAVRYSVLWSVPLGLLILSVLTRTRVSAVLAGPVLVRLGVLGYAMFLLKTVVIQGFGPVHAGTLSDALLALGWIGFTVLIAEGAHRYIGAPGRHWLLQLVRRTAVRA